MRTRPFMRESMAAVLSTLVLTLAHNTMSAQSLEVKISNIREPIGSVRVGLFDNAADFPREAVAGKVVAITADSASVIFTDLKPGQYAISVFHDENNNGKLDTGIFGIPKEGFAFGNNAVGKFGPPSFESARVTVGGDIVKQALVLKYF